MGSIIDFPTDVPQKTITLSGTEWLAVMLKLAGRPLGVTGQAVLDEAESKMLQQLKAEG